MMQNDQPVQLLFTVEFPTSRFWQNRFDSRARHQYPEYNHFVMPLKPCCKCLKILADRRWLTLSKRLAPTISHEAQFCHKPEKFQSPSKSGIVWKSSINRRLFPLPSFEYRIFYLEIIQEWTKQSFGCKINIRSRLREKTKPRSQWRLVRCKTFWPWCWMSQVLIKLHIQSENID